MTDLKPDNIFLHCQEGGRMVVKILDFGIARYAQELLATGDREKLTATQAMLGTDQDICDFPSGSGVMKRTLPLRKGTQTGRKVPIGGMVCDKRRVCITKRLGTTIA